jgi:hypothetical protein
VHTVLAAAARNNADWCDAFCRAHGIDGSFAPECWAAPQRTPPLYPDAVTLAPGVGVSDVLHRVEPGPGCSVKDSVGDLDLRPHGFRILFEAEWLLRVQARPAHSRWSPVRALAELDEWTAAWAAQPPPFFPSVLLDDPAIRILGARAADGRFRAGAIANRSVDVVGLSNVFDLGEDLPSAWADAADTARAELGSVPVVAYASGAALVAAHLSGFESVGLLRVWLHTAGR